MHPEGSLDFACSGQGGRGFGSTAPERARSAKSGLKRLVLLGVSVAILVWLWSQTGWAHVWSSLCSLNPWWFGAALVMFAPQTLLAAVRWTWIVEKFQPIKLARATALVLASSSLNVILPSKMGDVLKGAFLSKDRPGGDLVTGVSLGLFEKVVDTAALAAVMMVASIVAPPEEPLGVLLILCGAAGTMAFLLLVSRWGAGELARFSLGGQRGFTGRVRSVLGRIGAVIQEFQKDRRRLMRILALSIGLWILHLAQFSFVYLATASVADPHTLLLWSRIPMAIFIGLIPISFTGAGTRDAALVYLLEGTIGRGPALILGAFATLRYLVAAIAGLPFVRSLPAGRLTASSEEEFVSPPPLISRRRKTPAPTGHPGPSK